jgi:hypothetical protein
MTAAQQAKQAKQIEDLMATVAALSSQLADAPAEDKSATTKAKATAVKRNLDPVDVKTGCKSGDKVITFRVLAANTLGPCANGGRIVPLIDGRQARSLDRATLAAIVKAADDVEAALDTVDKRAKLGAFKPAKVTT